MGVSTTDVLLIVQEFYPEYLRVQFQVQILQKHRLIAETYMTSLTNPVDRYTSCLLGVSFVWMESWKMFRSPYVPEIFDHHHEGQTLT